MLTNNQALTTAKKDGPDTIIKNVSIKQFYEANPHVREQMNKQIEREKLLREEYLEELQRQPSTNNSADRFQSYTHTPADFLYTDTCTFLEYVPPKPSYKYQTKHGLVYHSDTIQESNLRDEPKVRPNAEVVTSKEPKKIPKDFVGQADHDVLYNDYGARELIRRHSQVLECLPEVDVSRISTPGVGFLIMPGSPESVAVNDDGVDEDPEKEWPLVIGKPYVFPSDDQAREREDAIAASNANERTENISAVQNPPIGEDRTRKSSMQKTLDKILHKEFETTDWSKVSSGDSGQPEMPQNSVLNETVRKEGMILGQPAEGDSQVKKRKKSLPKAFANILNDDSDASSPEGQPELSRDAALGDDQDPAGEVSPEAGPAPSSTHSRLRLWSGEPGEISTATGSRVLPTPAVSGATVGCSTCGKLFDAADLKVCPEFFMDSRWTHPNSFIELLAA
jgi:hypothetical protein